MNEKDIDNRIPKLRKKLTAKKTRDNKYFEMLGEYNRLIEWKEQGRSIDDATIQTEHVILGENTTVSDGLKKLVSDKKGRDLYDFNPTDDNRGYFAKLVHPTIPKIGGEQDNLQYEK